MLTHQSVLILRSKRVNANYNIPAVGTQSKSFFSTAPGFKLPQGLKHAFLKRQKWQPFHFPPCFPGFVWRHHLNHLFHCPSVTLERAPDFVYNTCKTRKISESSWPWSHRTWKKRHEISWWLSISCQLGSVRLCWTLLTVSSGGGRQYHPVMQCGWI